MEDQRSLPLGSCRQDCVQYDGRSPPLQRAANHHVRACTQKDKQCYQGAAAHTENVEVKERRKGVKKSKKKKKVSAAENEGTMETTIVEK